MATHYDDEAELERLKSWWKENWLALAGGLIIGLGAIFGYEAWKRHEAGVSEQASQIYEDMKEAFASNKAEDGQKLAQSLIDSYPQTPYAAGAAMRLAAVEIEQLKFDTAAARLQWVTQHSSDKALQQLARLRQARVLWQQGKNDEALKVLDGATESYVSTAQELRGDIQLSKGDRAAARSAYQKALDTAPDTASNREILQQKIDDLSDVAVAS